MPKRPHMSLAVKLEACLIALGLDPKEVDWHHQPPLSVRPYDEATGKWTPDANDPRHIEPMARAAHRERSKNDTTAAAKLKRIAEEEIAFRVREIARIFRMAEDSLLDGEVVRTLYKDMPPKKIPSRPFRSRPSGLRKQRST